MTPTVVAPVFGAFTICHSPKMQAGWKLDAPKIIFSNLTSLFFSFFSKIE
jgi:hypothetical protein